MDYDVFRLMEVIGGVTALSLLGWLVKRTFTHTIPRLATDFKESLSGITNHFRDEMRASREEFREELRAQRAEFAESLKQLREDFKGEIQYLGQRIDRLSDAVRERNKGA